MASLLCIINKFKNRSVYNLLMFLIINIIISINGNQCDSVADESQALTYTSTFKFLSPELNGKNKENILRRSSLPNKLTHPVILSPYRYLCIMDHLVVEFLARAHCEKSNLYRKQNTVFSLL